MEFFAEKEPNIWGNSDAPFTRDESVIDPGVNATAESTLSIKMNRSLTSICHLMRTWFWNN
jgi:hypothetical protein